MQSSDLHGICVVIAPKEGDGPAEAIAAELAKAFDIKYVTWQPDNRGSLQLDGLPQLVVFPESIRGAQAVALLVELKEATSWAIFPVATIGGNERNSSDMLLQWLGVEFVEAASNLLTKQSLSGFSLMIKSQTQLERGWHEIKDSQGEQLLEAVRRNFDATAFVAPNHIERALFSAIYLEGKGFDQDACKFLERISINFPTYLPARWLNALIQIKYGRLVTELSSCGDEMLAMGLDVALAALSCGCSMANESSTASMENCDLRRQCLADSKLWPFVSKWLEWQFGQGSERLLASLEHSLASDLLNDAWKNHISSWITSKSKPHLDHTDIVLPTDSLASRNDIVESASETSKSPEVAAQPSQLRESFPGLRALRSEKLTGFDVPFAPAAKPGLSKVVAQVQQSALKHKEAGDGIKTPVMSQLRCLIFNKNSDNALTFAKLVANIGLGDVHCETCPRQAREKMLGERIDLLLISLDGDDQLTRELLQSLVTMRVITQPLVIAFALSEEAKKKVEGECQGMIDVVEVMNYSRVAIERVIEASISRAAKDDARAKLQELYFIWRSYFVGRMIMSKSDRAKVDMLLKDLESNLRWRRFALLERFWFSLERPESEGPSQSYQDLATVKENSGHMAYLSFISFVASGKSSLACEQFETSLAEVQSLSDVVAVAWVEQSLTWGLREPGEKIMQRWSKERKAQGALLHYAAGLAKMRLNDEKGAKPYLIAAVDLCPGYYPAVAALARCLQKASMFTEAISLWEVSRDLPYADQVSAAIELARCYYRVRRHRQADTLLETLCDRPWCFEMIKQVAKEFNRQEIIDILDNLDSAA